MLPINSDVEQAKALFDLALQYISAGADIKAEEQLEAALQILPERVSLLVNLAAVKLRLSNYPDSLKAAEQVLRIEPDNPLALLSQGMALRELGRADQAVQSFERLSGLRPDYFEAWINLGVALRDRQRYQDALHAYNVALRLRLNVPELYFNIGEVQGKLGNPTLALASYEQALLLQPNYPEAHNNRGNVLLELKRQQDAVSSYDRAIALRSDYAEAFSNRGNALQDLHRMTEALASYDQAIAIRPDYAEAFNHRGNALLKLRNVDAAMQSYRQAVDLDPEAGFAFGSYLHARMGNCDWSGLDAEMGRCREYVLSGRAVATPFSVLSLFEDRHINRRVSEIYSATKYPPSPEGLQLPIVAAQQVAAGARGKIKLAFLSADFSEMPMGYNFVGFFEQLDRARFEVIAISFKSVSDSALSQRLVAAFDTFKVVNDLSDAAVCAWMRASMIDIAVDMMGPTLHQRQGIFALRCAPVQVNQYGWTSGAPYMDYIIADPISMPAAYADAYSDQMAFVRHTLFATDDKRLISGRGPSRAEEGLPEHGLVFCCFNNSMKITPQVFDIWMRVLSATPGSVLWVRTAGSVMIDNLRREARHRGVDPSRLVFADRVETMALHLARYRLADIFLDTFPFCAQTTASDALWAGLPVITCVGDYSMSRIGASLLHALNLPELVTDSLQAYEALILHLANDPDRLQKIRQALQRERDRAPLFDTSLYAHDVGGLYVKMHERHLQGLKPVHIAE